jgi:hypothetical protein
MTGIDFTTAVLVVGVMDSRDMIYFPVLSLSFY